MPAGRKTAPPPEIIHYDILFTTTKVSPPFTWQSSCCILDSGCRGGRALGHCRHQALGSKWSHFPCHPFTHLHCSRSWSDNLILLSIYYHSLGLKAKVKFSLRSLNCLPCEWVPLRPPQFPPSWWCLASVPAPPVASIWMLMSSSYTTKLKSENCSNMGDVSGHKNSTVLR